MFGTYIASDIGIDLAYPCKYHASIMFVVGIDLASDIEYAITVPYCTGIENHYQKLSSLRCTIIFYARVVPK